MARLQILPLPPHSGRPAPYALVVDQLNGDDIEDALAFENDARRVRDQLGADAVLLFGFTVDVVSTAVSTTEAVPAGAPCCARPETRVVLGGLPFEGGGR